jgi:transmembrane sensor
MGIDGTRGVLAMKGDAMGPETQDSLQARAIEWHVRLRHGDEATWEAFAEWLAQDPRHEAAYDAIEATDLAIEPLLSELAFWQAANDADRPAGAPASRARRWTFVGGALAASIVAAVGLWLGFAAGRYEVITAPGARQVVRLDSATQVVLNGSTRMVFDRRNPRFASLTTGEALFRVQHDDARPFTLKLGDSQVRDVGTVFNVVRDAGEVRVAVAEGEVVYSPKGGAIPLHAGQALVDPPSSGAVRVTKTPPEAVGAWRDGRLVYSGATLSQVAADLSRSLGVRVKASPSIANRLFSGTIILNSTGVDQLRRLTPALNVTLEAGPDGWTMRPIDGVEH